MTQRTDRVIGLALATVILLVPLNPVLTVFLRADAPSRVERLESAVRLSPLDILFVLLWVVAIAVRVEDRTRRSPGIVAGGTLAGAAIVVLSAILHPGLVSLLAAIRFVGVAGACYLMLQLRWEEVRRYVIAPLLTMASLQAILAVTQVVTDTGAFNASALPTGPNWTIGYGTFQGPYTMGAYLILACIAGLAAIRTEHLSPPLIAGVGCVGAGLATTYGRTVAAAFAIVILVFSLDAIRSRNRDLGKGVAAMVIPFVVLAGLLWSAWGARAQETADGEGSGRGALIATSVEVIRSHPWIGVGPGGYSYAIGEDEVYVVHNVPLLLSAELGVAVGAAFVAWFGVVMVRSLRSGSVALALCLALVPFFLLDKLHFTFTQGLALLSIWLGLLGWWLQPSDARGAPRYDHRATSGR